MRRHEACSSQRGSRRPDTAAREDERVGHSGCSEVRGLRAGGGEKIGHRKCVLIPRPQGLNADATVNESHLSSDL